MKDWLISQLSEPSIGSAIRRQRFETLIEALEICRSRSVDPDTVWTGDADAPPTTTTATSTNPSSSSSSPPAKRAELQPSIRTFVGSSIRAALLSPQSRVFTHTWYEVGMSKGAPSVESLVALVRDVPASESSECTVDLGWYLERLVEVVSVFPDTYGSADILNFDKHRYDLYLLPASRRRPSELILAVPLALGASSTSSRTLQASSRRGPTLLATRRSGSISSRRRPPSSTFAACGTRPSRRRARRARPRTSTSPRRSGRSTPCSMRRGRRRGGTSSPGTSCSSPRPLPEEPELEEGSQQGARLEGGTRSTLSRRAGRRRKGTRTSSPGCAPTRTA